MSPIQISTSPFFYAIMLLTCAITPANAGEWAGTSSNASSGSASSSVIDGNTNTYWASASHTQAQNTEVIQIGFASQPTNYVRLAPRSISGAMAFFPVRFKIEWSCGTSCWKLAKGFTHYPTPATSWVTLPLDTTVNTGGIRITASVLGTSASSSTYGFQLAEFRAGYNDTLAGLDFVPGHVATSSQINSSWAATRAIDGSTGTSWSSNGHSDPYSSEWIAYWFPGYGFKNINYVKIRPRYYSGQVRCFPEDFAIEYSNGSSWVLDRVYLKFNQPQRDDWIILPLSATKYANGIQIYANKLGECGYPGNYWMQFAEVRAGYDPGFEEIKYMSNDGIGLPKIDFHNVGARSFMHTDQLRNFSSDIRGEIIVPNPASNPLHQNIYHPSVVHLGGGQWRIFFGGWNGKIPGTSSTYYPYDHIYTTATSDSFMTFGTSVAVIAPGTFHHVNNPSVQKISGSWYMAYTTCVEPCTSGTGNKPAFATSTNGVNWTPSSSDSYYNINVAGYPGWAAANIDGNHTLFKDPSGLWYLFFEDGEANWSDHFATSSTFPQSYLDSFTYVGQNTGYGSRPMKDMRRIEYGNSTYYLGAHNWAIYDRIFLTINQTPDSIKNSTWRTILRSRNTPHSDDSLFAPSLVVGNNTILGLLYSAWKSGDHFMYNRMYAGWLQHRVVFKSVSQYWGVGQRSYGPNRLLVYTPTGANVETGRVYVYDTDSTTLLYRSPRVTLRSGDHWYYNPQGGAILAKAGLKTQESRPRTDEVLPTQIHLLSGHRLQYNLSTPSRVTVSLVDAQGRRIVNVFDQLQDPGSHILKLPRNDDESRGIRFLDFRAGSYQKTLMVPQL